MAQASDESKQPCAVARFQTMNLGLVVWGQGYNLLAGSGSVAAKPRAPIQKEQGVSLKQIAWPLGYEGSSSFNHAFKRWTGRLPSVVRSEKLLLSSV